MRTLDPTSQTTVILAAPQAQSAFAGEHPLVFELSRGASPALGGQIWTLTLSEHALLGRRTAASAPKLSLSLRQRGAPGPRLAEKPLLRSAVVKRQECLSCRVGIVGGHGLSRRYGQV